MTSVLNKNTKRNMLDAYYNFSVKLICGMWVAEIWQPRKCPSSCLSFPTEKAAGYCEKLCLHHMARESMVGRFFT